MPRYGHALYDFEGDESQSELTFFAGDEVTITNEVYKILSYFFSLFPLSFPLLNGNSQTTVVAS